MSRRCPLHDETLDPDTGHCDHCQRDARLDCTWCHGVGEIAYMDMDGRDWPMPCRHCQPTGGPPGWGMGVL